LGHPREKKYCSVHIAGTNGKGSTAAFTESIFANCGIPDRTVHLAPSEKINERIRVNGVEISE